MPLWLDLSTGAIPCQIYHPLSNVAADQVFGKIRSRFGATNLPMATSAKTLLELSGKGIPSITGYIADQTPSWTSIHRWIDFLNHDTPVFTGAEKISRKIHATAYYIEIKRPERNKYVARFVKISSDASKVPMGSITDEYFRLLEQSIKKQPPLWLWTHRRWRYKR